MYRAYLTADRTVWTADDTGDHVTEYGWVDASDRFTLEEARNYVDPVSEWSGDTVDYGDPTSVGDWIRSTVEEHLGIDAAFDNGDGTWYAQVETQRADGSVWTFALHFHVKRFDARRGWVEEPVTVDDTVTVA